MKRNNILTLLVGAIVLSLVLILVPVSSQMSTIEAAISWTKYGGNPILEEDSGEWDEGGVGAACVIIDGATYKMWYTGVDVGLSPDIGYATSSDGKLWTKYGANPVLTNGEAGAWDDGSVSGFLSLAIDDGGVSLCSVIKESDSSYKMWYTGCNQNIPAIGYATSSDGITWVKDTANNPVLQKGSPGAWDDAGVLSPCVIKEGGTYKMWYSGRANDGFIGSLQIGYATSSDGVNWVKYGTAPVLATGTSSDWDSRGVGIGTVIKKGSSYEMWYSGYRGYGEAEIESAIGSAFSRDGISWVKSVSNPVLTKGAGWETKAVGAPWVTYTNRTYHMWYSGADTSFDPALGYATYTVPGPSPGPSPKPKPPAPPPGTTDVSDYINEDGVFTINVTATSEDCNCQVTIDKGTTGLTEDETPLSEISITPMEEPPLLPEGANVIGLVCDFGPDKANFDPPATICCTYDPAIIPEGVAEENLVLAMWDELASEWVNLDSTVYTATHTICAPTSHFTPFTTFAYTRPALFITSDLTIVPEEVEIGEAVTIGVSIANTGDLTGTHKVTLKIDNVEITATDITLDGGASRNVTFDISEDTDGTYTVDIDGLAGTFLVKAAPTPPPTTKPTNWALIGGILAGFVVVIGVVIYLFTRRRG